MNNEETPEEEIYYEEPTSGIDAIYAANLILHTLDFYDMDDEKLTDTGRAALLRIKKRALKILDWGSNEIYDSIYDTE
jgi:hypothetical protein